MRQTLDQAIVREIADAVERQGGDLDDVKDLVATWGRMQQRLATASAAYNAGEHDVAEAQWRDLEREFSKPLDHVVRDHLGPER